GLPGSLAERDHGETRRAGPALLRGGDDDVDAPGVHGQANRAQRRDGVDNQELVKFTFHNPGNALKVVGDTGRRLVVGNEYGLDGRVSLQPGADLSRVSSLAFWEFEVSDLGAIGLGHGGKAVTKTANAHGQYPI